MAALGPALRQRRTRPWALPALLLACALPLASQTGGRFPYRLSIEPELPLVGEKVRVSLEIEGLSGAELVQISPDEGLSLESSSSRPTLSPDGRRSSLIQLELLVRLSGPRRVERLLVEGREGRLELGAFSFEVRAPQPEGSAMPRYRWKVPDPVYRYAAFPVGLEAADGLPEAMPGLAAAFSVPQGLALEPAREGLSWVGTALSAGELRLPPAELTDAAGRVVGCAPGGSFQVKELPPAISESRALGEFSLRLEGPSSARAGERLFLRLVVSGRGNHPSLEFPKTTAALAGKPLPAELFRFRRDEALVPRNGAYEGSSILELSFIPPGSGRLAVGTKPWPVQDGDGQIRELTTPVLTIEVKAEAVRDSSTAGISRLSRMAEAAAARLERLDSGPAWKERLAAGRFEELLAALSAPPAGARQRDLAIVAAFARWELGDRGQALAELLGTARRNPLAAELQAAAREALAYLGAGEALIDRLPHPLGIGLTALLLAVVGGSCLFLGRAPAAWKGKPRKGRLWRLGLGFLAGVLTLGILAAAASLERRREYAVVWTDRLLLVPSEKAESSLPVLPGQCAALIGRSPGFVGLKFPDGLVGWAPEESVYSY